MDRSGPLVASRRAVVVGQHLRPAIAAHHCAVVLDVGHNRQVGGGAMAAPRQIIYGLTVGG